jgi:hypothetical protein
MMGVTYDTSALIAADRGERRMWAGAAPSCYAARYQACRRPSSRSPGAENTARSCWRGCYPAAMPRPDRSEPRSDLVVSADEGDLQSIAAANGSRIEIDHP